MPLFNGNRIGSNNDPTLLLASGVWTQQEQCSAINKNIWPKTPVVWTPTEELSAFAGWYDVSVASSIIESSGTVQQWSDISGNDRNLTSSSPYRPVMTSTEKLNSFNTLRLNGSTFIAASQTATNLYHIIAVLKWITNAGQQYVWTGSGAYDYHGPPNSALIYANAYTTAYVKNAQHIINDQAPQTATTVSKQLNWCIYTISFSTTSLGAWRGTGYDTRLVYGIRGLNAVIAEILLIKANPSGIVERSKEYLTTKWAL